MASVKKERTTLDQEMLSLEDAIVALKKGCGEHPRKFIESVDVAFNI